jgi:hypothetical protein
MEEGAVTRILGFLKPFCVHIQGVKDNHCSGGKGGEGTRWQRWQRGQR